MNSEEKSELYYIKNSRKGIYKNLRFKKYNNIIIVLHNNKKYLIIILIFISLILIYKLKNLIKKEIINFRIIKKTKVCICSPVKDENRYIKEFVEHYKKYGVDKIFIYDNNEIDGERLENVIGEYIKIGLVKVLNYRGQKAPHFDIMNDCYKKNYRIYDWLIFFDLDEYIHLFNYTNIKLYLQRDIFKKCEKIHLNWVHHTDNNLLYYDERPLHIRFPEVEPNAKNNVKGSYNCVKSILRGHIPNVVINCVHKLNMKLKGCDGFGNPQVIDKYGTHNSDFRFYYIDHYYSKSVQEFAEKLNKGGAVQGKKVWLKYVRLNNYFKRNNITIEKLNFIENLTKLNLTKYKILLKNPKQKIDIE